MLRALRTACSNSFSCCSLSSFISKIFFRSGVVATVRVPQLRQSRPCPQDGNVSCIPHPGVSHRAPLYRQLTGLICIATWLPSAPPNAQLPALSLSSSRVALGCQLSLSRRRASLFAASCSGHCSAARSLFLGVARRSWMPSAPTTAQLPALPFSLSRVVLGCQLLRLTISCPLSLSLCHASLLAAICAGYRCAACSLFLSVACRFWLPPAPANA